MNHEAPHSCIIHVHDVARRGTSIRHQRAGAGALELSLLRRPATIVGTKAMKALFVLHAWATAVCVGACGAGNPHAPSGSGGAATGTTASGIATTTGQAASSTASAAPSLCPPTPTPPATLPNSAVPSGACTGPVTCDFVTVDPPCPNPQDAPPMSQWHCACPSGQWQCTLVGKGHTTCESPPETTSSGSTGSVSATSSGSATTAATATSGGG
jgi:hypothetical protein